MLLTTIKNGVRHLKNTKLAVEVMKAAARQTTAVLESQGEMIGDMGNSTVVQGFRAFSFENRTRLLAQTLNDTLRQLERDQHLVTAAIGGETRRAAKLKARYRKRLAVGKKGRSKKTTTLKAET